MSERKQISVSEVIEDLNNGLNRLQIGEKYGLTAREVKIMFQHPSLKGKKVKKVFEPSFELIDDIQEETVEAANESTDEASTNTDDNPQEGLFT